MPRRMSALRPVKSLKHVVNISSAIIGSTVTTVPLAETVAVSNLTSTTEVDDGSTINAIFLQVEAVTTAAWSLQPAIYLAVFKNTGDDLANPQPNLVGISGVKRQVLHQEMKMLAQDPEISDFPRTVFSGVIRIPPRLKRMGYQDKLYCLLQGTAGGTGTAQICLQCIYKEFR